MLEKSNKNILLTTESKPQGRTKLVTLLRSSNSRSRLGWKKVKRVSKAVNVLKEDRQAFGLLVGKATTPKEAHSHSLTSVPLALATADRGLYDRVQIKQLSEIT